MKLISRVLWGSLVTAVVIGALFVLVFPTRAFIDQRSAIASSKRELAEVEAEVASLNADVDRLRTPTEIERLARERFGLIIPGEQAYVLRPPQTGSATFPDGWPWPGFARLINGS